MSQLTTHILNTSTGKPAAAVPVLLYREQDEKWIQMALGTTNEDGRIPDLLKTDVLLDPGHYKLKFETKAYFQQSGILTFYPFIEIVFTISGSEHYHIPLLLNPFGYTTYRGS